MIRLTNRLTRNIFAFWQLQINSFTTDNVQRYALMCIAVLRLHTLRYTFLQQLNYLSEI